MSHCPNNKRKGVLKMLSTKQVAELLNVSPRVVQQWCKDNKLKCIKIGKSYRIYDEALTPYKDYLNESKKEEKKE